MNILITGGRSDMAQEMVKLYTELGHNCIVTASTNENIDKLKEIYKDTTVRLMLFSLQDAANSKTPLNDILESTGIDILVLNAWNKVDELKLFHKHSDQSFKTELDGNVKGNIWLIKEILPHMVENNFGRILFISSIAAISGAGLYGPYCLGKAAIEGLIYNLAVDYGQFNILSNILRPGIIKTERTRRFWDRDYYIERVTKSIPQKKLGEPKQIAKATLPFIDEDSYINGTSINVSGGLPLVRSKGF